MLTLFVCWEFVLHNPCCLHFYACSFSYTSHAGFIFMPARSFCYACLLHFVFFSSFFSLIFFICFYIIIWGVSLTQPALVSFFLSLFIGGVSLTHPVLVSYFFLFLSGEFLLHIPCLCHFYPAGEYLLLIPCWLHFYLGSFSYTSRAGFNLISKLSLTYPMLDSFLLGEFLLHIPCWLHFR